MAGVTALLSVTSSAGVDGIHTHATRRTLRFAAQISNPTSRIIEGGELALYLPLTYRGGQVLLEFQFSMPHQVQRDQLGHCLLRVPLVLPPYSTKVGQLSVQVLLQEPQIELLEDSSPWLAHEPFIESNSPEIRALAAELAAETQLQTARAIYDWVRRNLHYAGYVADDLGAAFALKNRRGDCTEYADLCAALARAAGVPARVLGGYVVQADASPRPSDYHNWCEMYLDFPGGGRWWIIDAQKQQFGFDDDVNYVGFHIISWQIRNGMPSAHRYEISAPLQLQM